ncbi:MAG: hypothetical protein JW993_12665 [Sedimentisphaerales bacterium]|nr:hypothetical protein [Sedimentisphaerales bacterium]
MGSERNTNRRAMLASVLRCTALGAVAAAGGAAIVKRRRLVAAGVCVGDGTCRDCGVWAECGLPQALTARRGDHARAQ